MNQNETNIMNKCVRPSFCIYDKYMLLKYFENKSYRNCVNICEVFYGIEDLVMKGNK
jgi:hypothetical protein